MKRMYQTKDVCANVCVMVIKVDQTKRPDKMHLDAQIRYPSRVWEDKRRKKPKYKNWY